jgi:hypothetical protein
LSIESAQTTYKKLQHALPFFRQRTAVHAYLKISVFSIQVLLIQALFDAGAF